jgi:hypothetical protein
MNNANAQANNQGYGGNQNLFGNQQSRQKTFSKAPNLNTAEIKQIVDAVNRPPFMSNLSLVEFDDKPPLELLELLNRLLGHLDNTHQAVDIQKETQDKT